MFWSKKKSSRSRANKQSKCKRTMTVCKSCRQKTNHQRESCQQCQTVATNPQYLNDKPSHMRVFFGALIAIPRKIIQAIVEIVIVVSLLVALFPPVSNYVKTLTSAQLKGHDKESTLIHSIEWDKIINVALLTEFIMRSRLGTVAAPAITSSPTSSTASSATSQPLKISATAPAQKNTEKVKNPFA